MWSILCIVCFSCICLFFFFFFKQKTAYEMRISDWGSDVCSSDLINLQAAERVASEIGSDALALKTDVSKKEDVDNLVARCQKEFGSVDIVVNNAGTTHKNQPMLDVDEATFARVFNVNVKSLYLMTCAVVPVMLEQSRGDILNVQRNRCVEGKEG